MRHPLSPLIPLVAALALAGCAAMGEVQSDVVSYGPWPASRQPASYAFERLPSQQAQPQHRQLIEDAARPALARAGFQPAADAAQADYLLQVGARVSTRDPWVYNDGLFLRSSWRFGSGYGHARWGGGWGWGWSLGFDNSPTFEREVALLIRDRPTGQLLYEVRASNAGPSASIDRLLPAMFAAALKNFPATEAAPQQVTVPLAPQ